MILLSDGMKSASKSDLDLLLILKTTNTLKLNGEKRRCCMSRDKCWPALALFAQMQCSKIPCTEGTQQLQCLQIILTLIY